MVHEENHIKDLIKSLFIMASMIEARDPYTGGHLWRVSQYSRLLAEDADLSAETVARISMGGFLHDLGKIAVPDAILNKPGRLSAHEHSIVQTHPVVGVRLVHGHPLSSLVESAILSHHERPDGTGYPQRLSSNQMSIDARIVGICDAFDAMTSNRPYRRGMPVDQALYIIDENLGAQFDTRLGRRFIMLGNKGVLDPIRGHSEPGIPVQECPICGPTIIVTKQHHSGDHVYCRVCGGEAEVYRDHGAIKLRSTGQHGSPHDLEPEIDHAFVHSLVSESARHIVPSTS